MRQTRAPYRFEQFFATRRLLDFAVAPDGESVYFVTDISGQFNLWRVPAAGGWPEQLTLFERESVRQVSISRDGRRIAFVADPDGNEMYQVYLMDAQGGWPEKLTDQDDVQHILGDGAFSPDGRRLAYAANARARTDVDIFLYDVQRGEARAVTPPGSRYYPAGWSPDGERLLAVDFLGNTNQDLLLVQPGEEGQEALAPHPGEAARFLPGPWEPDGSGFYLLTDLGREYVGLARYDLQARRWAYVHTPERNVDGVELSADGALLAWLENDGGRHALHVQERSTGRPLALPALPAGVVNKLAFAPSGERRLFLAINAFDQAAAIYVLDLEAGSLRRITQSMFGNLPPAAFVAPELVHIDSFDGTPVPAWLYRPRGAAPGARVPALLSIHGGPEAQEQPTYAYGGLYQYLLSRGIAILAPNIRGSGGFSRSYQRAIYRDWGGAELKDIEACARYLQSLQWVDPRRLGVFGGSFGGFATLSAAARLPQYWACACDIVGPANLVTFTRTVPPHWRAFVKELIGDPDEDYEMLVARSPITYAEQIRCPLFVVQGANDPRVVQAESDQMVAKLRALGREVEYLVFEDEGHGFAKRSNQLKAYRAMAAFLEKHLLVS